MLGTIADAMTVFAKVSAGQGHVLHGEEGHVITPIIISFRIFAHEITVPEEDSPCVS